MNPAMMNKIKKMQKEIQDAQAKIESSEFIGKASGVTVIIQGSKQLIDVKINEEMLEDIEMLQDALVLAVNDGLGQIEKAQQAALGPYAGMMGGLGF